MSGGEFWIHDATFCVGIEKAEESRDVFLGAMRRLSRKGYCVTRDPRIEKDYKSLSPTHRRISKETPSGLLQCDAQFYPAGMKFECYQDVVFENPNGGRYDFRKVSKMPFLIRMRWKHLMGLLREYFVSKGFVERENRRGGGTPLEQFNAGWNYWHKGQESVRFKRDTSGWPDDSELQHWQQLSADGVHITQGVLAYSKTYRHRWVCGRLYGGINGMWLMYDAKNNVIENHNASHYWIKPPCSLNGRQVDRKKHIERLEAEIRKAFDAKNWKRLAGISKAMENQVVEAAS